MGMTHYMELMMGSWYLLVLFMALPMFLAECYVVSEILLLMKPREAGALSTFNKLSAYASALVIALLSFYAATYFLKITEWRTWIDVIAAVAYVLAGLPFIFVGLAEAGFVMRAKSALAKGHAVVTAVVAYLILSHAAMVFGMFDPMHFGWEPEGGAMDHSMHGGMAHEMPMSPAHHHDMNRMPAAASAGDHCNHDMVHSAIPNDLTGMKHHAGHPIPEGYHRMPDGRLMKNSTPMP